MNARLKTELVKMVDVEGLNEADAEIARVHNRTELKHGVEDARCTYLGLIGGASPFVYSATMEYIGLARLELGSWLDEPDFRIASVEEYYNDDGFVGANVRLMLGKKHVAFLRIRKIA